MRPFAWVSAVAVLLALLFSFPPTVTGREPSVASTHPREQAVDERLFPSSYPGFLRELYVLVRERGVTLEDPALTEVIEQTRDRIGQAEFEKFLERFGLDPGNSEEIALEIAAQIARIRRREEYLDFVRRFDLASSTERRELVRASDSAGELEYALRNCEKTRLRPCSAWSYEKKPLGPTHPRTKPFLTP